jgi:hypothetical protein
MERTSARCARKEAPPPGEASCSALVLTRQLGAGKRELGISEAPSAGVCRARVDREPEIEEAEADLFSLQLFGSPARGPSSFPGTEKRDSCRVVRGIRAVVLRSGGQGYRSAARWHTAMRACRTRGRPRLRKRGTGTSKGAEARESRMAGPGRACGSGKANAGRVTTLTGLEGMPRIHASLANRHRFRQLCETQEGLTFPLRKSALLAFAPAVRASSWGPHAGRRTPAPSDSRGAAGRTARRAVQEAVDAAIR